MLSATTEDEAPRLAWILQMGLKRPAGNASLNSLRTSLSARCLIINGLLTLTLAPSDQGDSIPQTQLGASVYTCRAAAFGRDNQEAAWHNSNN